METAMKIDFKVHGVSKGQANVPTMVEGESITGQVPCLEVELTTVLERNGSLTLRFVGASIDEAQAFYTKDKVLTATFAEKAADKAADKPKV
jgi:hypothetical protein